MTDPLNLKLALDNEIDRHRSQFLRALPRGCLGISAISDDRQRAFQGALLPHMRRALKPLPDSILEESGELLIRWHRGEDMALVLGTDRPSVLGYFMSLAVFSFIQRDPSHEKLQRDIAQAMWVDRKALVEMHISTEPARGDIAPGSMLLNMRSMLMCVTPLPVEVAR